jgi:hypothetical protein
MERHKAEISRHRATWKRGETPPGFWDIGFPDTQVTEEINREAEEMQRKKWKEIEREVERGEGKYRRTGA